MRENELCSRRQERADHEDQQRGKEGYRLVDALDLLLDQHPVLMMRQGHEDGPQAAPALRWTFR